MPYDREKQHNQAIIQTYIHREHCQEHKRTQEGEGDESNRVNQLHRCFQKRWILDSKAAASPLYK